MKKLVVCGTGHRPDKLGNSWSIESPISRSIQKEVYSWLKYILEHTDHLHVIAGGALGFDTHLALATLKLKQEVDNVALEIAVPHKNFNGKWSVDDKEVFELIASMSDEVHYVSTNSEFSLNDLELRNRYMVRKSDIVLALWDGSNGGTYNAFTFAERNNKPIIWLKPKEFEIYTEERIG